MQLPHMLARGGVGGGVEVRVCWQGLDGARLDGDGAGVRNPLQQLCTTINELSHAHHLGTRNAWVSTLRNAHREKHLQTKQDAP